MYEDIMSFLNRLINKDGYIQTWLSYIISFWYYKRIITNIEIELSLEYNSLSLNFCLKNINSCKDAVIFLKRLSNEGNDNIDKLANKVYTLYSYDLPTEIELAKLSLLQQSVINTNGPEEYAISTVWMCAMQSIIDAEDNKKIKYII